MSTLSGTLEILGRVTVSSNQTFLCDLLGTDSRRVIYKPISGERPLWDFPTGTLAHREYAAWLVSDALGWGVVPLTVFRDGPRGPGMVQQWIEVDTGIDPVDVVRVGRVPPGYVHVLDAEDAAGQPVQLVHEDSAALARMAAFDVIVNNTDRKGGHILPLADGRRLGVDHGVCFHTDDKLRTVLWGFAGRALPCEITDAVTAVTQDAQLCHALAEHLAPYEVERFLERCGELVRRGRFPQISGDWPPIPWPPF